MAVFKAVHQPMARFVRSPINSTLPWETDLVDGNFAPAPPASEYQLVTDVPDNIITDLFETVVAILP